MIIHLLYFPYDTEDFCEGVICVERRKIKGVFGEIADGEIFRAVEELCQCRLAYNAVEVVRAVCASVVNDVIRVGGVDSVVLV